MLTPFSGSSAENVWNDSYNFYLSPVRIKTEKAFGILVNRWGLLRGQLQRDLKNASLLILAAAKLHNYCLN